MTYTSRFPNDIFISYARVDNQVLENGGQGWVDLFRQHLQLELSKLSGRMDAVTIWCDHNLTADQDFDDSRREIVQDSALFIAITSPGYLRSDYCQKELHSFHQSAASDGVGPSVSNHQGGNHSRIFNVLIYDIPHAKWPKEYGNILGFLFVDKDSGRGYDEGIGFPTDPTAIVFQQRIRNLAAAILGTLDLLNEKLGAHNEIKDKPPTPKDPVGTTEEVVFVCYDRDDEEFSLALATKIKEKGINVWIDQWNLEPSEDWDRSIEEALNRCARFLIVLSPSSVNSDEVRGELRFALDEKKPIVPVLHKDCMIPRRLRLTQRVDFRSRSLDDEAEMNELLKALKTRRK